MSEDNKRPARPAGRGAMQGGPGRGMVAGEKPKDFKGTLKKLVRYLSTYRTPILIVLIFAAASSAFAIAGPKIMGKAITKIFEGVMQEITGSGEGIDFAYVARIILILLGLYLLSAGFSYVQGWIMSGVSKKITYGFRRQISEKINRMPFRYFDGTSYGEVLSRVTNDVDTLNQTLNQSLTQIITSVTTIIGVFIMMVSISWLMTLVALFTVPLSSVIAIMVVKHSQKYFREQQEYLGHVNGHVEEMYGGHLVVKAFNGEKKSMKKFNGMNDTLYNSAWKSQFLTGMMMPVMNVVGNIGYVVVCVLGGWLAIRNTIQVGDIQAFIQYVRQFNHPIAQMANISNVIQQAAACAERIFEFIDEEEESPDKETPVKPEKIHGIVEFTNVHFGYDPGNIIINDFSVKIEPGQKVAIVGPTGAGKTTIVKLLMRFYDLNDGSIMVDGHDIREFTRNDLRSIFGMVLQDTWLYNASIADNIRYGKPDASLEEVVEAARTAHAHGFINTLPGDYDLVLNEATTNISEGQKQLLTIARVILTDPSILILDEATSSVDTHTEIQIQKAMDSLMKGRTSFIIAHRLSTIRNADLILAMDHGDIVEQGTHKELLERGGFYADLYNSQFDKV